MKELKTVLLHAYTGNGYPSAAERLRRLRANGIIAHTKHSCYVGMKAFEVSSKDEKAAVRYLW